MKGLLDVSSEEKFNRKLAVLKTKWHEIIMHPHKEVLFYACYSKKS